MFYVKLILNSKPIRSAPFEDYGNSKQIYENFHQALEDAVLERTVSDVELGVYLSGGIDSKTVASYLSELNKKDQLKFHNQKTKQKLKTFTVGFDVEEGFDETNDAVQFALAAGYDPHVCRVNYDDLSYAYPIAVYYSENIQPYTNGAAKWWLSRFTSQYVKGVLTGDGADELLCGYPSFRYAAWWKFAMRNRSGKTVFDKLKNHPLSTNWRDSIYQKRFHEHAKDPWLSGSSHAGTGSDFVESLHTWGVAHPLFGQIKATAEILLGAHEAQLWLVAQRDSVASWFKFGFGENEEFYTNPEHTMLLWQNYFSRTHLPVQVLNWVGDRMEMANALEGRPPFLSKKLKHLIFNLGDNFFIKGFGEKFILKRNFLTQFPQYANFLPIQKKQFNAPALFHLNSKFHSERILDKLQKNSLIHNNTLLKLLNDDFAIPSLGLSPDSNDLNAHELYAQSYLQSTLQTLVSFTYVDDYIKDNKKLERDFEFEHTKIATSFKDAG